MDGSHVRLQAARALGAASEWALKNVFHRPAANFPGKIALYADPQLIADMRTCIGEGTVVVVGTNGKTTVTNLLADALEAAGKTVACNRTGANLDSGVATALLQAGQVDWGVFESDELWLARIAPELKPDYVVLLNLFRDQLDRAGEIEHVQEAVAHALSACPQATLVYNADDPFCQAVAERVDNECVPFGIAEDLGLPQNAVADSGLCQRCDEMLTYDWRQYGQLGNYHCPGCGFERTQLECLACEVAIGLDGVSLVVRAGLRETRVRAALAGAYSVYNLLAVCAAADCCGIPLSYAATAIEAFSPGNGRLQTYKIDGHRVVLTLAKNPTGLNQSLRVALDGPGPKALAFFINDREADGRDVSWLWDADLDEIAGRDDVVAFAGGLRKHDMQVRLKYAGVDAQLVDGAGDFLANARAALAALAEAGVSGAPSATRAASAATAVRDDVPATHATPAAKAVRDDVSVTRVAPAATAVWDDVPAASFFLIANYTALPAVKAELDAMAHLPEPTARLRSERWDVRPVPVKGTGTQLTIVHVYPELLNLYGDGGNVAVLAERARWRGIDVRIARATHERDLDLEQADIVFVGGGPDREQRLASTYLMRQAEALRAYVEDDGVVLAICGGYQVLGHEWLLGDTALPGLGLLDVRTGRAAGGSHDRLVGNIALASPLARMPVVGYENHAGRTYLGDGCEPFGSVVGRRGKGNNGEDGTDGARWRNVVGTYLHGPLLAKNPDVADWLLTRALARRAAKEGRPFVSLIPLDDAQERAANEHMRHA